MDIRRTRSQMERIYTRKRMLPPTVRLVVMDYGNARLLHGRNRKTMLAKHVGQSILF